MDVPEPECPECGGRIEGDVCGTYCLDCDYDDRQAPERPEGGWPRGSDMDRI